MRNILLFLEKTDKQRERMEQFQEETQTACGQRFVHTYTRKTDGWQC